MKIKDEKIITTLDELTRLMGDDDQIRVFVYTKDAQVEWYSKPVLVGDVNMMCLEEYDLEAKSFEVAKIQVVEEVGGYLLWVWVWRAKDTYV